MFIVDSEEIAVSPAAAVSGFTSACIWENLHYSEMFLVLEIALPPCDSHVPRYAPNCSL